MSKLPVKFKEQIRGNPEQNPEGPQQATRSRVFDLKEKKTQLLNVAAYLNDLKLHAAANGP